MRKTILSLLLTLLPALWTRASVKPDTLLLGRIFNYAATIDTMTSTPVMYAYKKYSINVARRNVALLPVPTMYRIAHGPRRRFMGETYDRMSIQSQGKYNAERMVALSTLPHHHKTLPTTLKYLTPKIYEETVIENYLLSPFCRTNRLFYKYRLTTMPSGLVLVKFTPRVNNTQLLKGAAVADSETGRIINGYFEGEYDMITFHLVFIMGEEGVSSLYPVKCELTSQFKFIGNKIDTKCTAYYSLSSVLPDTIRKQEDMELMALVRPEPLTKAEQREYNEFYEGEKEKKKEKKEENWAKHLFWDVLGDNLLNKISSNFGPNDEGYVRINPLFNPLFMGYSKRKGYYYKFDIRTSYSLTANSFLFARFKAGYSFKRKQFYFNVPLEYHFDKRHHGYVQLSIGNGNWIKNGAARDKAQEILPDTAHFNFDRMIYFKDFNMSLLANYDLSKYLSVQAGIIMHRRAAVEKAPYMMAQMPTSFRSVAPVVELSLRPWGWGGPVINASLERSIKGFMKSDIDFERWEVDMQYIHDLSKLRYISYRAGFGTYTHLKGDNYFLDYTNFRENNLPGGWNDEWSGEFELLNRDWYNLSKYYVRANLTYESPLLLLSWVPVVGRVIEKERLYISGLLVTHLHPYLEFGYSLTTRWISMGLFMANRNGKYDGFGLKVGFELFRQW